MKKNVAVIFGGRSVEHDVSIVTGLQLIENVNKEKYNVIPVYIARDGNWYTGEKLLDLKFMAKFDPADKGLNKAYIPPVSGVGGLVSEQKGGIFGKKQEVIPVDVVIPAMHGLNGEDGTLQGLLELANLPYTSAGVVGSSAGMDKILMKAAFKGADIPVLESTFLLRDEWKEDPEQVVARIENTLEYPIFVKPANLGSSIGINRADDRESLEDAIDIAVRYDHRVLCERGLTDYIEINCSCAGYSADARPSVCEQPVSSGKFLSYDEKYIKEGKMGSASKGGMANLSRIVPAPIGEELTEQVRELTKSIFKALDCKGVVRIDFLYDKAAEKLYANEINTIPGSFAYYLWEPMGMKYSQLIDFLIECALRAHRDKQNSNYGYDSTILQKVIKGAKQGGTKGAKI